MPLPGIPLFSKRMVHRTRLLCKCEYNRNGSKLCNSLQAIFREPTEIIKTNKWCAAKSCVHLAAMLDSTLRAP